MKYPRTKKLAFFNNKGGVGKTTLAFNCAVAFAERGYKTVLIDLDAQCNLTKLALGSDHYEDSALAQNHKTIYDVLRGVTRGGSDVDTTISFEPLSQGAGNLSLLRSDLRLSEYENLLGVAYNQAAGGQANRLLCHQCH